MIHQRRADTSDRRQFLRTAGAMTAGWLFVGRSVPAQTEDPKVTRPRPDFDMAAYLDQLSAKGKARGYKEFAYKITPQGELRIYSRCRRAGHRMTSDRQ